MQQIIATKEEARAALEALGADAGFPWFQSVILPALIGFTVSFIVGRFMLRRKGEGPAS